MTKRKIFIIPFLTALIIFIIGQSSIVSKTTFVAQNQLNNKIGNSNQKKVKQTPKTYTSYSSFVDHTLKGLFFNKENNAMILKSMFNYDVLTKKRTTNNKKDFTFLTSKTSEAIKEQQRFDFTFKLLKDYQGIFASNKEMRQYKKIIIPFENFYKKMSTRDNYFMWIQSLIIFWDYMMNYLLSDSGQSRSFQLANVDTRKAKDFWKDAFKKEVNKHINLPHNLHWKIPPRDISFEDLQKIWKNTNEYFYNNYK